MLLFGDVCKDSYNKWFYTWLSEFRWFSRFLILNGIYWYVGNYVITCKSGKGPKYKVKF